MREMEIILALRESIDLLRIEQEHRNQALPFQFEHAGNLCEVIAHAARQHVGKNGRQKNKVETQIVEWQPIISWRHFSVWVISSVKDVSSAKTEIREATCDILS